MRVLVTGGAGFIGANFLNLSVPRHPDWEFVNFDALTYAANLASLRSIENRPNYTFVQGDLADADLVERTLLRENPDLVVHLAAESHVDRSIVSPDAFIRSNVLGTFHLLQACRKLAEKNPAFLFHHVSTDEVYGSLGKEGLFREDTPYDPSSPYSASKAASDHLVIAYHRTYGLRVKLTNCSNNYGPLQFPEKLIPLMISNALLGKELPVYGTGNNVRDWLHVEDHCEAIWNVIAEGEVGRTYNVGGGNEIENLELVRRLCRLVAEEANLDERALSSRIVFVKDRPGHDLRYAIDSTRLRTETSWKPKHDLETGLRQTVRWYLDNEQWVTSVRSGAYRQWIATNYDSRR